MTMIIRHYLPVCALAATVTLASTVAKVTADTTPGKVSTQPPRFMVLYDPGGTMTLKEVLRKGDFTPLNGDSLRMTAGKKTVWLRFMVNGGAGDGPLLLEVAPSFPLLLDRIHFYVPDPGGAPSRYREYESGAKVKGAPSGIHTKNYIFPIPGGTSPGDEFYLRIESTMDVQVWPGLTTENELRKKDLAYIASYGIMYGILCAMVLYNIFIFFVLRDRTYVLYVLYVMAGLSWQMSVHGHLRFFMEPPPGLYWPMLWCSVGLFIFLGAFVVGSFLNVREYLPRMRYLFITIGAVGFLAAAAGLAGFNKTAFSLSHAGGMVLPALCAAACVVRIRQGFKPAVLFLTAWLLLITGSLVFTLMGLQLLPVGFLTVNAVAVGITAEAVLLSLALADRIAELRRERETLKQSQYRYHELSITDELTGLYNRRHMMERLQGEIDRSGRTSEPLCLAIMDLDDFKNVNDTHGHLTGDEVLKGIAAALIANVRNIDTLCRYGGEEFLILMPSTAADGAKKVAGRIRSAVGAKAFSAPGGTLFTVTASIGIAQMTGGDIPVSLLERADKALYEAKHAGKNRVACDC